MTLIELMMQIESLDDALTIYAEATPSWDADSKAVAALEPEDGGIPAEAAGMEYLLEVSLAKEAIAVWRLWRGQLPSTAQMIEAVIYYAEHDAYLPLHEAE